MSSTSSPTPKELNETEMRNRAIQDRDELMQSYVKGECSECFSMTRYYTVLETEAVRRGAQGERPDVVYDEEYRRLSNELRPEKADRDRLGYSAAELARRREKRRIVNAQLRDHSVPIDFSRACSVCLSPSPHTRSLFTSCRHVICSSCDAQLVNHVRGKGSRCPFCERKSTVEMLVGEAKRMHKAPPSRTAPAKSATNFRTARQKLIRRVLDGEIDEETWRLYYERTLNAEAEVTDNGVYRRLGIQRLPKADNHDFYAMADTANAARRATEKLRLIRSLKAEELSASPDREYSRICSICCCESPRERCVFIACGHAVCRACAEQFTMKVRGTKPPTCPFCRKRSDTVVLVEEEREEEGEEEMEEDDEVDGTEDVTNREHEDDETKGNFPVDVISFVKTRREQIVETMHRGNDDVYDEEYRRLDDILPRRARGSNLAADAAAAARREQRMQLISELRAADNENNSSSLRYSRLCPVCSSPSPLHRNVFIGCGHSICRICAEEKILAAGVLSKPRCPCCREKSGVVPLFENVIEKEWEQGIEQDSTNKEEAKINKSPRSLKRKL